MARSLAALAMAFGVLGIVGAHDARQSLRVTWEAQDSGATTRLRGISAVSRTVAWASGAGGTIRRTVDGGATWQKRDVAGAERLDFRDIDGVSSTVAYALSIGPGESSRIYKTSDGGGRWDLQFANSDPKVFLDAMTFWDADRGLAFSDSVDGQFVVLTTRDGGRRWERVAADRLPPALPNEGAFAASGTNIAATGGKLAWIGTTAGRVLRTVDGGSTWTIASTPVRTGEATGIFSIAFRDARHGVVVGGDYRKERDAVENVAVTSDGGLTWSPSAGGGLSGFRSVVAWIPQRPGHLLAVGPAGADSSTDGGTTWTAAGSNGFDTLSFAPGSPIGWASGDRGRIAKVTIHD